MRAQELLESLTDDELKARADGCFIRAESRELYLQVKTAERQRLLAEADFYLKALIWRHDERTARRDFRLELIVIFLIAVEIALSLYFGILGIREAHQQSAVLDRQLSVLSHMDTSSAATAAMLQQEQAERGKKPKLVLYVGSTPIDKATVRLKSIPGTTQDLLTVDLFIKNEGDAPASAARLQILTPEGVGLAGGFPFATGPESGPPLPRNAQRWSSALPQLPVGETTRISAQFYVQKDHATFKIAFSLDAPELPQVVPLGSLTVLSAKP
jgi:hypothetical protein